jgi:hypothetical protein
MYLGTLYISARSDFKYGRLVSILENRCAMSLVVIICFRSHFVTTRGIDLKLYTCVPLQSVGHTAYIERQIKQISDHFLSGGS